jgi:titin
MLRDGMEPLGNRGAGVRSLINGVQIGGTAAGARNVISGNLGDGVDLSGGELVQGNYIGIDAQGTPSPTNPVGNAGDGIRVSGESLGTPTFIGGTIPQARNVISGNASNGVNLDLFGAFTYVLGNFIGTDATGTRAVGNVFNGVFINSGVFLNAILGNTVGGTTASAANVISGNLLDGVAIVGDIAQGNMVVGNLIGTTADGHSPLANHQDGVSIQAGATLNTIGGSSSGVTNLISGNESDGIHLTGRQTTNNLIEGNRIGTDGTGSFALANGQYGVLIVDAHDNQIGSRDPFTGNIISGNALDGVSVQGMLASGNQIQSNLIGTDILGGLAIGNGGNGVSIEDAPRTLVGGLNGSGGNVISGNERGILLSSLSSTGSSAGSTIAGNLIGTDRTGRIAIGNHEDGVTIRDSSMNTIGGSTSAARNLIAGNAAAGIHLSGSSRANQLAGNWIGTSADATAVLPNAIGVAIDNGTSNVVANNLISGNAGAGVQVSGSYASATLIQGNRIGTDPAGKLPLGNGVGVFLDSTTANTVGGTAPGAGNLISGNFAAGVYILGRDATGNLVAGNIIGPDAAGLAPITRAGQTDPLLAHQNVGVLVNDATGNTIGGSSPPAGNLISGNVVGVNLAVSNADVESNPTTQPNAVQGNLIGLDATGMAALGNDVGVYLNGVQRDLIGGPQPAARNVISGNGTAGIDIVGQLATGNTVQNNIIGLARDGRTPITVNKSPSGTTFVQSNGIFIQDASNNILDANVLSGNDVAIYILGHSGDARANIIRGNLIGASSDRGPGPGNSQYGVLLFNAPNNKPAKGRGQTNRFYRNGIANIREFTGPEKNTVASTSPRSAALRQNRQPRVNAHRGHPSGPLAVFHLLRRATHAPS